MTKQEMSNLLGIPRNRFAGIENGRLKADDFFYERMIYLYGIDLRQPEDLHKIVFADPGKVSAGVYAYLSELGTVAEQ